ncbi:hypothetical protein Tco_1528871, partial [Tanacetum coccineum]
MGSTVTVNGGQRRSTVADHREPPPDRHRTTTGPPPDHRSTTVAVNGGSAVGLVATWHHVSADVTTGVAEGIKPLSMIRTRDLI